MGFLQDITGQTAAKKANEAAQDTFNKQYENAQQYETYGDTLQGRYRELATALDPYASAGNSALQRLMAGLGLSDDPNAQADFTKAYQSLPGYQSGLNTGTQAAMRALNAGPGLQSGGALKALQRYGSDYENQRVGDYLSRLAGLTGSGQAATGAQVGTEAQGIAGQQQVRNSLYQGRNQSASTIGQGMIAGANAESSALGNLLGIAGYLGGSALGGGFGKSLGTSLFGGGSGGAVGAGTYGGIPFPIFG